MARHPVESQPCHAQRDGAPLREARGCRAWALRLLFLAVGVVGLLCPLTLCWLEHFVLGGRHGGILLREVSEASHVAAPAAIEAIRCFAGLPSREPWVAIYGDSLARGVLFDLVTLLNGSASRQGVVHPGHSADYSEGCTVVEARPPTNRTKCGGFEYGVPLAEPPASHRPGQVLEKGGGSGGDGRKRLRFTYRLKTFTWEPAFDEPWLAELASLPRLPDVLLLSSGIWDMQYPPGGDPARGLQGFNHSLGLFLAGLRAALGRGGGAPAPRIFWLTVTAVSDRKLPEWKRPLLSATRSRAYNELAAPLLRKAGAEVIDTFSSGLRHPEESKDGVHFPGKISRFHARLFLRLVCGPSLPVPAEP